MGSRKQSARERQRAAFGVMSGMATFAEAAIRDCRRHGSRDLHCYQCPYCNGWHLTHRG
mgnify:CR=1 FL=1